MKHASDTLAQENKAQQKLASFISEKIMDLTYEIILQINLKTGSYNTIKSVKYANQEFPPSGNFPEIVEDYKNKNLSFFSDEEKARNLISFDLDNIEDSLKLNPIISVNYTKSSESNMLRTKVAKIFYTDKSKNLICFARSDITESLEIRHDMNEHLRKSLCSYKKSEEERNTFLSNMSHDMRTPINAILGITQLSMDKMENISDISKNMAIIQSQTKQLLYLVDNIFDIHLMEEEKFKFVTKGFTLPHLLKEVEETFIILFSEKNFDFRISKQNIIHKRLLGDEQQIIRAINTLLSNSGRFTPPGGRIFLRIKEMQSPIEKIAYFSFIVSDNGVSVVKQYIKGVLTPLYSTDESFNNNFGLSIVKAIVNACGGSVTINPRKHEGTVVTIYLPILIDDSEECTDPPMLLNAYNFNKLKVLLIEDNHINQVITEHLLREHNCIITTAGNGSMGYDVFNASPEGTFDIIFMDIEMPIQNGYNTTKFIRKSNHPQAKSIPIIAVTANVHEDAIRNCFACGMNGHIGKPIELKKIYDTLVNLNILN